MISCVSTPKRIDNMEAALLPHERTDLVSTNRLGYGWATRNWPVSKPSSKLAAMMAVILAVIENSNNNCLRKVFLPNCY